MIKDYFLSLKISGQTIYPNIYSIVSFNRVKKNKGIEGITKK